MKFSYSLTLTHAQTHWRDTHGCDICRRLSVISNLLSCLLAFRCHLLIDKFVVFAVNAFRLKGVACKWHTRTHTSTHTHTCHGHTATGKREKHSILCSVEILYFFASSAQSKASINQLNWPRPLTLKHLTLNTGPFPLAFPPPFVIRCLPPGKVFINNWRSPHMEQ